MPKKLQENDTIEDIKGKIASMKKQLTEERNKGKFVTLARMLRVKLREINEADLSNDEKKSALFEYVDSLKEVPNEKEASDGKE